MINQFRTFSPRFFGVQPAFSARYHLSPSDELLDPDHHAATQRHEATLRPGVAVHQQHAILWSWRQRPGWEIGLLEG